eukprot:gene27649-36393_t
MRLKCRYEGDIRIVTVTAETDFAELRKRLSSDYGFDVSLKYEDRDGDMITLASQNDLNDLILSTNLQDIESRVQTNNSIISSNASSNTTVNVTVSEAVKTSLPTLHANNTSNRLKPSGGNIFNLNTSTSNNNNNYGAGSSNSSSVVASNTSLFGVSPRNFINRDSNATISTQVNGSGNVGNLQTNPRNNRLDRFPTIGHSQSATNTNSDMAGNNIRWKRGEMLGQGAFGIVYLGLNVETGELMAVKQMTTEEVSRRELGALENEINLLRNLRHPNIVRYIGTEVTALSLSIFLEYVPGGSLKALIDKFGHLEEPVAKSYTRQLLIGLEYLHRNGIAHRDIKGANCLVGNDG